MAMPQQMQQASQMPELQQAQQSPVNLGINRKAAQTNILATLVPQIMNAVGGGDPYTQKVLMQQEQMFSQQAQQKNQQGFMRSVMLLSQQGPIKPDNIMQQAELWDVGPEVAMDMIQKFQAFQQAKRGRLVSAYKQIPAQSAVPAAPASLDSLTGLPTSEETAAIPAMPAGMVELQVYENDPRAEGVNLGKFTESKPETPVMPFGSSPLGIYNKATGDITQKAPVKETPLSNLSKLIRERNSLKPGDPNIKVYDAAIEKESTKSTLSAGNNMVDTIAMQVVEGRLDPSKISKRGGLQQAVFTKVEELVPGTNLVELEANARYKNAPGNLQSRGLINGVEPLYDSLLESGKTLNNGNIQLYNKAVNFAREQTGDPKIVGFNNLRDDVIAETERILMGSGVLSDSKYQRALHNVNSAQSFPQLEAAVKQLKLVVKSREEALDEPAFKGAATNVRGKETPLQEVSTKKQYDSLPSGTIYLENGKRYRKP